MLKIKETSLDYKPTWLEKSFSPKPEDMRPLLEEWEYEERTEYQNSLYSKPAFDKQKFKKFLRSFTGKVIPISEVNRGIILCYIGPFTLDGMALANQDARRILVQSNRRLVPEDFSLSTNTARYLGAVLLKDSREAYDFEDSPDDRHF